jgi:thiaminase (transcriptional activator TenA)
MVFRLEADMPFAAGTLYARLRADSGEAWERYVAHPFVGGLAAGTLDRAEFGAWLAQDYLYLVHYARAYALMVYKSGRVAEMAGHAALLHGLLDGEMALHRRKLAEYGIDPEACEETLELVAYSRYMLDRGISGDVLDLAVTLAACLGGYGEIGLRLARDPATRLEGNPYRDWIETYAGAAYHDLVRAGIASLEALGARLGAAGRYDALRAQFREAVRLEACFWDAGRSALGAALGTVDSGGGGAMLAGPRGALARG